MPHPSYGNESLNPEQAAAVHHVEGPMMILAGAGSGKTRVITHRAAYLVGGLGVDPRRVLAVTFTNKAASEMRQRAIDLGGSILFDAQISTIHRLGVHLLRRHGSHLGIAPDFSIVDAEDQRALLRGVLRGRGLSKASLGRHGERHIATYLARAKEELADPVAFYSASVDYALDPELFGEIVSDYERSLKAANALDFGDLLARPVQLLTEQEILLEQLQRWYSHVMVDEYQDINKAQDSLLTLLADGHRNLVVVGDDDQCIYTWRGADVRLILDFVKRYPDANVVRLTRNYRSSGNILACANHLAQGLPVRHAKELWTDRPPGLKITVVEAEDTDDEAEAVARTIAELANEGMDLRQIGILYRVNSQSRELETELRRFRIDYRIRGAPEFYQRREIKDLIAYLRVIHNDSDLIAWRRIINMPPRGIGPGTLANVEALRVDLGLPLGAALELLCQGSDPDITARFTTRARGCLESVSSLIGRLREAAAALPLPQLLEHVFEQSGYRTMLAGDDRGEDRLENVQSLLDGMAAYATIDPATALLQFLEDVALVSGGDDGEGSSDGPYVEMMTLHRAKGLEYDCVFVCGFVDGMIPHSRSFDGGIDEERRLAYVGMTRARDRLYLTHAARARGYWGTQSQDPSRFLADVPIKLIDFVSTDRYQNAGQFGMFPQPTQPTPAPHPPTPVGKFASGQKVHHASFGNGTIISSAIRSGEEIVAVAFDSGETKNLMVSHARLQPASSPSKAS